MLLYSAWKVNYPNIGYNIENVENKEIDDIMFTKITYKTTYSIEGDIAYEIFQETT